MQKYNNMPKEQNNFKGIVLEFLDFLRYKIENDRMTMEDVESLAKTMECNLNLCGTADDFARFYGKSKTNVNAVISRKVLDKPSRKVLYPFKQFRRSVPNSWNVKEQQK